MALNETFNTLPKNTISLDADLTSYLPKKVYWDEELKEHPSKKKNAFSIGTKIYFFYLNL